MNQPLDGRDRFQMKKVLGNGAFGTVKLAQDRLMDKLVAIKIPINEGYEQSLRKELKILDSIRELLCPHLVMLEQAAEVEGRLAIVMEYVDGGSLRHRMIGEDQKPRTLPIETAVSIAMQVCQALVVVKRGLNLIHRDIKPENILLRRQDGRVKLADFGLARILDASQYASSALGTPPYMSPEVLQGRPYDHRVDVYAVGVVLYEAVTGRLPFQPRDVNGQPKAQGPYIDEICAGGPVSPRRVAGAGVDEMLDAIIMRAIDKRPARRYASAEEFHDALDRYYAGICVDAEIAQALAESRGAMVEQRLRQVVKKFPASVKAHINLGWFYNRQLRFEEACRAFERGCATVPDCADLWMDLALTHERLGRRDEAINAMARAMQGGLAPRVLENAQRMLALWQRQRKS